MPLRMFELLPGASLRYRVLSLGPASALSPWGGLVLVASRPREGASLELELSLLDAARQTRTRGRVPLAHGYLGVVREVERQVEELVGAAPSPDFELVAVTEGESELERQMR